MSFIRTGLRELALKVKRQRTRIALRHQRRLLQRSEIALGREGTSQAANFPELRNEIVALKKLEQEQREVAVRIAQIEEGIKKIEADRAETARAQHDAIAKLEAEKKPLLQRRDEAKSTANLCDRELSAVERRVQENERIDRDLLKEVSELQALAPPPADLDARLGSINSRRARLPDERAELIRARLGSEDACRVAKEKLVAAEAELAVMEKNIERVRAEFDARDRSLAANIRAQQDALREARAQHQTVEERKNPAYLNIGRHLASQRIAPPNAPHLLDEVHRHREAVERHLKHKEELALVSSKIDKQELRQFYFSVISVLALLGIILPLVFQRPKKRDWLPQETETILAINIDQLQRDDLPKRWSKEQPEDWANVWRGLIGAAAASPGLDVARDVLRVTRALTTERAGSSREFILVEARAEVSRVVRSLEHDPAFKKRVIAGLPIWEASNLAVSRVGPSTLAVGRSREVDALVRVRLGIDLDLKTSGQLFERFRALDRESALRLISRNPPNLVRVFQPTFASELLDAPQVLGLAITLQNPVKAKLLMRLSSPEAAAQLADNLRKEPQRWLRLQDSNLLVYAQPPEILRHDANVELRFVVPENSARLLLQRLASAAPGASVAAQ